MKLKPLYQNSSQFKGLPIMKTISITTFTLFAIILVCRPASAYWPTTLEENLAVQINSASPSAVGLGDGRILVASRWIGGNGYNIINRYGELQFPELQPLIPGVSSYVYYEATLISDGEGGALACWDAVSNPGIYAQRLDSLGNLMWGDSGVVIYPIEEQTFDISLDGQGGFYLGIIPDSPFGWYGYYWVQRINGEGNLMWPDSGISIYRYGCVNPRITYDGMGGCYLLWEQNFSIYCQRLDGEGNQVWVQDVFIHERLSGKQIIPDGEGGCIVHIVGMDYGFAYRVSPGGTIQWTRDHVSFYTDAKIVQGEPGYFYLGYSYQGDIYGQRMDIEGNFHWPSWPSAYGALMWDRPGFITSGGRNWHYYFPHFYAIFGNRPPPSLLKHLTVQSLDISGNPILGINGVDLTIVDFSLTDSQFEDVHAVISDNGFVGVYDKSLNNNHDVYAKRCFVDGTLGGPMHLLVALTPHNPPIQIPPSGGSFTFDISIEDTYSVAGVFDLWIEVTLPGGDSLELMVREDLTIDSNSTIIRTDLQQFVPYRAPAGEYTYTAYVGNHECNVVWSEDSFTFEKLPGIDSGRASLAGMTSNSEAAGMTDEGWMLEGFFDGSLEGSIESVSSKSPDGYARLSAFPNPFNDETVISYKLQAASFVELKVYDITGREVALLEKGYHPAGDYTASWNGEDCTSGIYFVRLKTDEDSVVRKVLLVK